MLSGGRFLARRAAAALRNLPEFVPPLEFPCRIERLPEGCSTIDNELYDDAHYSSTWHAEDTSRELATLQLLNAARIPYFDRVWRQQLQLPPTRPGNFLEVGCGGGVATAALGALGYRVTGVDPAAAAIEAAREHAARLDLHERLVFAEGSAYDLSAFPAASFDGVLMADVLEHLLDLPSAVREVRRVLRPGGVLVFDTINRTYKSYLFAVLLAQEVAAMVPPNTHDWRLFIKPHEMTFLLQAHGFLADTSTFRGMAPTVYPPPPSAALDALRRLPERPPPLPLSDFVEISSLEVNYLGWALRGEGDGEGDAEPLPVGALSEGLRRQGRVQS